MVNNLNYGTVIIPVLNEAVILHQSLQDLLCKVQGRWDIIVVDGGSTDGSQAVVQQYPVKLIVSAPGRARQMNAGADHATGPLMLFLHADACLPNDFIQQIELFTSSRRDWGFFEVKLLSNRKMLKVVASCMNVRSRLTSIATGDQGLVLTQSFWKKLNGFRDIWLMEDIDFCRRAKAYSVPFCSRSALMVSARKWEREGVMKTIVLMWLLRFAFFIGLPAKKLHRWYYKWD